MPRAEPTLQNRMGVMKGSRGVRPTVQGSGDHAGQTFHSTFWLEMINVSFFSLPFKVGGLSPQFRWGSISLTNCLS